MSNVWYFSYFGIEIFIKLVIILILIFTAILYACNWQKEMQVLCSLLATVCLSKATYYIDYIFVFKFDIYIYIYLTDISKFYKYFLMSKHLVLSFIFCSFPALLKLAGKPLRGFSNTFGKTFEVPLGTFWTHLGPFVTLFWPFCDLLWLLCDPFVTPLWPLCDPFVTPLGTTLGPLWDLLENPIKVFCLENVLRGKSPGKKVFWKESAQPLELFYYEIYLREKCSPWRL